MKVCPTCRKTYPDDGLNFCLDDGTVLTFAANEPPPTVMRHQPRPTDPAAPKMQTRWDAQPQYSLQPPAAGSSGAWKWVVGIMALLVLFCGGGFVGLMGLALYVAEEEAAIAALESNSNVKSTLDPDPRARVDAVPLNGWIQTDKTHGITEYVNGELVVAAKSKAFYYVLTADEIFAMNEASTRVTVRNVDDAATSMGIGLVFHSNPTPLQQGYAFLIDTKQKRYRVVRHYPKNEATVVKWTNSSAIKDGSQENLLEVRDRDGNVDLYINSEKVTSIRNAYGYKNGVPGIYSGDGIRAAFSKLEIRR
ncbi:MAG: hypothetical protein H0V76_03685 [Blastocatellia bacterium]|nr:hypothetical protein [Blastocatellia bacterium]